MQWLKSLSGGCKEENKDEIPLLTSDYSMEDTESVFSTAELYKHVEKERWYAEQKFIPIYPPAMSELQCLKGICSSIVCVSYCILTFFHLLCMIVSC